MRPKSRVLDQNAADLRSRQVTELLLIDGVGEIAERLGHSRRVPRVQSEALTQRVARVRSGQPLIDRPAAVEQTVSDQRHNLDRRVEADREAWHVEGGAHVPQQRRDGAVGEPANLEVDHAVDGDRISTGRITQGFQVALRFRAQETGVTSKSVAQHVAEVGLKDAVEGHELHLGEEAWRTQGQTGECWPESLEVPKFVFRQLHHADNIAFTAVVVNRRLNARLPVPTDLDDQSGLAALKVCGGVNLSRVMRPALRAGGGRKGGGGRDPPPPLQPLLQPPWA